MTMLRLLLMWLVVCVVGGASAAADRKSRVHVDEPLSRLQHDDDRNHDYDHEAFLGRDDAKMFEQLPPEESKRRLSVIVDKIDGDGDGLVSEDELKVWIEDAQRKHTDDSVERQWSDFDANHDDLISWDEYKNATYGSDIESPGSDPEFNSTLMMMRDERRFRAADTNGDKMADRREFSAFLHPEDHAHMKDIVLQEAIEDIDKDGDGLIDLQEYIGDMWTPEDGGAEPEWVGAERKQFSEFRDKNNDGKMDRQETLDWILPSDYNHAHAEAKHLLTETDTDQDGKLTKTEILDKYDVFVGSQVTDFGEALLQHDEF